MGPGCWLHPSISNLADKTIARILRQKKQVNCISCKPVEGPELGQPAVVVVAAVDDIAMGCGNVRQHENGRAVSYK